MELGMNGEAAQTRQNPFPEQDMLSIIASNWPFLTDEQHPASPFCLLLHPKEATAVCCRDTR